MNTSNLIARATRNIEIGETPASRPGGVDHNLDAASETDYVPTGGPAELMEELRKMRVALAHMLSRETGQDVQHFLGPVVDNHRLCTIADNIWNNRRWSA